MILNSMTFPYKMLGQYSFILVGIKIIVIKNHFSSFSILIFGFLIPILLAASPETVSTVKLAVVNFHLYHYFSLDCCHDLMPMIKIKATVE